MHKALCGRDTKTFFLPHLSPADQELLQSIKDEEFESTGMSYKEYVTSSPLGMSWQVRPLSGVPRLAAGRARYSSSNPGLTS